MTAENGWLLWKTAFYHRKFYIMGGLKWRLKIFGPKYQEAHPNAKYGRINRSAYVAVAVDKRYTALRKKQYARIRPLEFRVVYDTASPW